MKSLALENGWSGGQFSLFRILFGIYLLVHFLDLLPWATEIFSNQGMLADGSLSPILKLIPNIFILSDTPLFVQAVIACGAIASVFFMLGRHTRVSAFVILYILACLYGRNPLIANPALPYVGFMLLACLFIPTNPYGTKAARVQGNLGRDWVMPMDVFLASWLILALTYSYSGYTKLLSPSWVAGENINYVLNNPLARDYFLRDFMLWLPPIFLKLLTWTVLIVELLFAPLCLIPKLRPYLWGAMLLIQLGFAGLLNFFDLTAGMLLFHLFTFDPVWVKARKSSGSLTLFYDGQCGMCHGVVRFLLAEDKAGAIRFSPLQGAHVRQTFDQKIIAAFPDSIVLLMPDGTIHIKSTAVAKLLITLGGLWTPLGFTLLIIPRPIRDIGYSAVGRIRKKIFRLPDGLCPVIPTDLRARFVN